MDKLKELFSRAGIKYIISVDDCYLEQEDCDLFQVKEHMASNLESAIAFLRDNEEKSFAETLEVLPPEDIDDYIEEICSHLSQEIVCAYSSQFLVGKMSVEKEALVAFFRDLKNANCIDDYYTLESHTKAQDFFDNLISRIPALGDGKVLWMIDKDLSISGGASDGGIVLIKNLISSNARHSVYALTSAQLGSMSNDDFRSVISDTLQPYQLLRACVIQKDTITEKNYSDLYSQISSGIRHNSSGNILQYIDEIFNNAFTSAGKSVKAFGNDTIYRVFFESGKAEGISPIDVFQRLLLIIIKDDIAKNLSSKYDDIAKLIYEYNQICDWCNYEKKDLPDFAVIREARVSECYDIYINRRFLPVSSGDIFSIDDEFYCLIGQACDLTIRDDSKRKNQCALLAKIIDQNDDGSKAKYPLNYFQDAHDWYIDFNDTISVDFNVLDLCALNEDGKAVIKSDYNLNDFRFRYTGAVYGKMEQVISYNRTLINKYEEIEELYREHTISVFELCEKIRDIFQDNSMVVKPTFLKGIEYNVRRQKRLSEEIIDDIVKKYSEQLSRKALNYDFAKGYQRYSFKLKSAVNMEALGISEGHTELFGEDFQYYQNKGMKEDELKKEVIKAYDSFYRGKVISSRPIPQGNTVKCDIKNRTITLYEKFIPVRINNDLFFDVFHVEKEKISIKFPIELIQGIKNRRPNTYKQANGSEIVVNNQSIKFCFTAGSTLSFFDDAILENKVSLNFTLLDVICLTISYEEQAATACLS